MEMDAVLYSKEELHRREQAYLEEVQDYLKREIEALSARILRDQEEDRAMKAAAFEEGLEFKSGAGRIDSAQIQESLRRNYHHEEEMKARLEMLRSLAARPFFARIDLRMHPDAPLRHCYIGLRDLVDERAMKQWVVDWRAPVASLYYDGEPGMNRYDTLSGPREVELIDKYQYLIRDGRIEEIYRQTDERYDSMLHEVLSEHASPRLEAIAATLQKEQNAVIRTTPDRDLLLSGVAGSGKSSVAMHRAAWLLYRNPKLQASDLLLISPNHQFIEYVADILPTLQGEPLRSLTMEDLCRTVVGRVESRYRNYVYPSPSWEKAEAFASRDFFKAWRLYLSKLAEQSFRASDITFADQVIRAEDVANLWLENSSRLPLYQRPEAVLQLLLEQYRHRRILWHREKVLEQLEAMLPAMSLREHLDRAMEVLRQETPGERLDRVDLSLLAALVVELYGAPQDFDVQHLMVDEMQDLMLWQHELLRRIFPATKTILGDPHQALQFIAGEHYLKELIDIYGGERVIFHHFRIAYRSSWEISEFSKGLVDAREIESLERHGEPVRVYFIQDNKAGAAECLLRDFAAEVQAGKHRSYAVICETEDEISELQDLAEQLEGLNLQHAAKFTEDEVSTLILTPTMARGMEFDSVRIYSPELPQPDDQQRRQALYVAASRALHHLSIYTESVPEALYNLGIEADADYLSVKEVL